MSKRAYEAMFGGSVNTQAEAISLIESHKRRNPGKFSYQVKTVGQAYGQTRYMPMLRAR